MGSLRPASSLSLSLFELSQVLSAIGLRPSSPGLYRVHMRSYPILPTVALIRDSPAWPRPGDSHRPWRHDRKALHLPRCAIHGQWIPSPLPSLCRSSKKEETKRNPLRHGTVRAERDGEARRTKAWWEGRDRRGSQASCRGRGPVEGVDLEEKRQVHLTVRSWFPRSFFCSVVHSSSHQQPLTEVLALCQVPF